MLSPLQLTFLRQIHGDLPPTLEGRNKDLERFGVNVPGETRPSGFSGWRDVPLGCLGWMEFWVWQRLKPSLASFIFIYGGLWMVYYENPKIKMDDDWGYPHDFRSLHIGNRKPEKVGPAFAFWQQREDTSEQRRDVESTPNRTDFNQGCSLLDFV